MEKSLSELGFVPQTGDSFHYKEEETTWLLVDVVEALVPRSTDYAVQKKEYSGKKKNTYSKIYGYL